LLYFLTALLNIALALSPDVREKYEDCVIDHRLNLIKRHGLDSCEKAAKDSQAQCHNQYGEDFVAAVESCKKKYNIDITPEVNIDLAGDPRSRSGCAQGEMQSITESCRSVAETTGTRCSRSEADQIISQASRKPSGTQSMQEACQKQKEFSNQAEAAMRNFESKCGPAIMEGRQICQQAQRDLSSSSCDSGFKESMLNRVSSGFNAISMHEGTLSGAKQSITAASNSANEAKDCEDKTKATDTLDKAKDLASAASAAKSNPYAGASQVSSSLPEGVTEKSNNLGTQSFGSGGLNSAAGFANRVQNSDNSIKYDGGPVAVNTSGNLEETEGTSSNKSTNFANSSNAKPELSAGEADKKKLEQARQAALAGQSTVASGRSRGQVGRYRSGLLNFGSETESSRGMASLSAASNNPDLSQFLPHELKSAEAASKCSVIAVDGITGPYCSQWDKTRKSLHRIRKSGGFFGE
jgi:hypothetical protein